MQKNETTIQPISMKLQRMDEDIEKLDDAGLFILQKKKGFRFGSDAVALAEWAATTKSRRTIDLGTGTGIIALLLGAKTNTKEIVAIELQEEIAEMAQRSIQGNSLHHRISVYHEDVRSVVIRFGVGSFDLVVSNPPYFRVGTGAIADEQTKSKSRHELAGTLEDFITVSSQLLGTKGTCCMVYKPDRLADLICLMRANRLEPKELRMVQARTDLAPALVLLKAKKDAKPGLIVHPPLLLEKEKKNADSIECTDI